MTNHNGSNSFNSRYNTLQEEALQYIQSKIDTLGKISLSLKSKGRFNGETIVLNKSNKGYFAVYKIDDHSLPMSISIDTPNLLDIADSI